MSIEPKHWFPAKRFGWGWGVPNAWQGWAVLAVFGVMLIAGAAVLLPAKGAVAFVAYTAVLTVVLIAVCWVKGERPRWRWGGQ